MHLGTGDRLCHFLKCLTLDKVLESSVSHFLVCKRNSSSIYLIGLA